VEKVQAEQTRPTKAREKLHYETFTDWARDTAEVVTVPVARFLAGLGIHPNTLSLLGFLLSIAVAAVLAIGQLTLGGWLLAVTAPIDAFDGALARVIGQKSRFGAFLDSTLDRLSEAAVLSGLASHYLRRGTTLEVMLIFAAMIGSVLVSYTRARAEGLGFSCRIGVLTRMERAAVLVIGLILGYPAVALWTLAVGANLTALQRILHVYRQSQRSE